MRCACGQLNRTAARYCDACGDALSRSCSRCGTELRSGARFCDTCGEQVASGERPDPPPHLVRKILRERPSLEGERRTVTILFADAVGSTPTAERSDPEAVYGVLQDAYERMTAAVHRYEGTVMQFTGDGIMAIFGAPIAHEDSARRAVAAALDMRDALERKADEDTGDGRPGLRFRIGLNTGPVVVGGIGDDLAMEYTAVGDTTNLAARMEQMAAPGSVYVTDHTRRLTSDYFEFEDLGPHDVKGKSEPVGVHRAVRARDVRDRFEAAAIRGLTPYVGRGRELSLLGDHYAAARDGRGQVVFVTGEAGIGKSRVLLEARRTLAEEDVWWLEGHATPYGVNTPHLPVADVVKNAFGVEEADDEATIVERVERGTERWSEASRASVPYLRFLLRVDPADTSVETMDPRERRAGIHDALRILLVELSGRRPLVVVIEDVHWADERSAEAIRVMADAARSLRVLLLLTARPGYAERFPEIPHAQRLALGQLADEEGATIVRRVLERSTVPDELVHLIAAKAGGNPLFIEEVAKSLTGAGILREVDGAVVLDRPLAEVAVPDTLQDVILSRIDRLGSEAREALQLASVIGREFTVRLLARISGTTSQLEGVLNDLRALELVYESSYVPEVAFMFKHALTHDVAYSTLLTERRRALHRLVGTAIEELYAERLQEHYETLAHHFEEAGDWARAYPYLRRSAERATQAFALDAALDFLERAIRAAGNSRDDSAMAEAMLERGVALAPSSSMSAIAALDEAIVAARAAGDRHLEGLAMAWRADAETTAHQFDRGARTAKEALRLAEEGDYGDVRSVASAALCLNHMVLGRLDDAERHGLRGLAETGDLALQTAAGCYLALIHNWRGRPEVGLGVIAETGEQERVPNIAVALLQRWGRALLTGSTGSYEGAIRILEDVLAIAERVGEGAIRARAFNTLGWIYAELEHHEAALRWNRVGLDFAVEAEFPDMECEGNARLNLADSLVATGRFDEAARHLDRVEAVVRDPSPMDSWMLWSYSQHLFATAGTLALRRGDVDAAIGYADECFELARDTQRPKNVVKALRLRGEALAHGGDLEGAETSLREAIDVAEEIRFPAQTWATYASLGEILRMGGRERDAAEAARRAASVVDDVASALSDRRLRSELLSSPAVRSLREDCAAS